MESTILNFLFPGRKTFSAERVFMDINEGGLGIPRLQAFIDSIRVKFAARALSSKQPWAILTKSVLPNNDITKMAKLTTIENIGYNAKSLASALMTFHKNFYKHFPNKWSEPIFFSALIDPLTQGYILNPPPKFINTRLENATLSSLYYFRHKRILTAEEIGTKFNVPISTNEYFRLYSIMRKNLPPADIIPAQPPLSKSLSFCYRKNSAVILP